MGTHSYLFEVRKDTKKLPWNSLDFNITSFDSTGNSFDFLESEESYSFCGSQTCREFVLVDLSTIMYAFYGYESKILQRFHYLVGIKSSGEMYTKVAKILRKRHGLRKLEKFYQDIFGLKFKLSYKLYKYADNPANAFLCTDFVFQDGRKVANGEITVKFFLHETKLSALHAVISALLALLREPLITERILFGKIYDRESLAKSILTIAKARLDRKDVSYDCFMLTAEDISLRHYTRKEILERILDSLSDTNNDDGSDYFSMTFLAAFVAAYNKEVKGEIWDNDFGVVDYVYNRDSGKFLSYLYSLKRLPKYFRKFLDGLSIGDYYDFEDD